MRKYYQKVPAAHVGFRSWQAIIPIQTPLCNGYQVFLNYQEINQITYTKKRLNYPSHPEFATLTNH